MKNLFLISISAVIGLAVATGILIHVKFSGTSDFRVVHHRELIAKRELYDIGFWLMPVNERVTYISPHIEARRSGINSSLHKRIRNIGLVFGENNDIAIAPPWCVFTCDHDANIIGFTLLPSNRLRQDDCFYQGIEGDNELSVPLSYRGYDFREPVARASGAQVAVRSLISLQDIKSLEYIDFGVAGFDGHIWTELGNLASSTNLRGLVVFQSRSFFSQRGGMTVPQITGIVVHWEDSRILDDIGQAFPNLRYLCLCLPNSNCLRFLFDKGAFKERLGKLQALYVVSNVIFDGVLDDSQPAIQFSRFHLPPHLEYIYLDGSLLSRSNMQRYDQFGHTCQMTNRNQTLTENADRQKKLDVVFGSYGFAGGGARSVYANEYQEMSRFWRQN